MKAHFINPIIVLVISVFFAPVQASQTAPKNITGTPAVPTRERGVVTISDRITVHNKTPRDIYVAVYYIRMKLPWDNEYPKATLAIGPQFLEADSSGIVQRPARKVGYDRELVFLEDKIFLKDELTKDDLKKYHSTNIGDLQGDVFYIYDQDAEFYGATTVKWNVEKPIIERLHAEVLNTLPAIKDNPYKTTPAKVRVGNDLAPGEKAFLQQRTPRVKAALEKLLGKSLDKKYIPKVALVCSGGGYRAMLYTTGALVGADKVGILDTLTYMVGLSGSTWAIGGWVLSGKPIRTYHDWLVNNIRFGLKNISSQDAKMIGDYLLTKYFYEQPFDVVDIYGALLANELFVDFDGRKQRQTLSAQAQKIESGMLPFPIYTAIAASSIASEGLWYEFSPYEVGASWLSMYAPSWAFGRKFKNGVSVNFAPEQNFGVLMATFGLAIGLSLTRLIQEIGIKEKANTIFVKNIIEEIILKHGQKRITTSDFFNFTAGMNQSKLVNQRYMECVDAGINYNLPYPPISGERPERTADIMIFVDASGDNLSADLQHAQNYARARNLKFPTIDYNNVAKRGVNIFINENDPHMPIIIYLPRVVDSELFKNPALATIAKEFESLRTFDIENCIKGGSCSTFNFVYPEQAARLMTNLGAFNMIAAKEVFLQAVNWKIDHLSASALAAK